MKTKNEVSDISIVVPKEAEVGEHEVLEKVGEVMSIMDKVVIVKGAGSQVQNRAADRALDSDTLLVFEDRKVLGYVGDALAVYMVSLTHALLDLGNLWSHYTALLPCTIH